MDGRSGSAGRSASHAVARAVARAATRAATRLLLTGLVVLAASLPLRAQSAEVLDRGRALIERAEAATEAGDVPTAALAWFEAGQLYHNARLFTEARQCFETLEPLAQEFGHPVILAAGHVFHGAILSRANELEDAVDLLERGLTEAEAAGQDQLLLLGASSLGDALRKLGRLDEARAQYERAGELMAAAGDDRNRIANLGQLARLAELERDPSGARALHDRALALAAQVGDDGATTSALLASAQFEERQGHLQRAEEELGRALSLAPTREQRAALLGQLGNIENTRGRYGDALASYDDCLALARDLGDPLLEATALANLGVLLVRIGHRADGAAHLEQALELLPEDDAARRAQVLVELADARRDDPDPAPARALLEEARDLADRSGDPVADLCATNGFLILAYEAGDFATALGLGERLQDLAPAAGARYATDVLGNVADLRLRTGDAAGARTLAAEAIAAAREMGEWRAEVWPLLVEVEAALALDDLDGAEAALVVAEQHLRATSWLGLPADAVSRLRSKPALLECGEFAQDLVARRVAARATAADADGTDPGAADPGGTDPVRTGFARADLWKGRALLQGIAEHRATPRDAPDRGLRRALRETETALQQQRQALARALQQDALSDEATARREDVDALLARRAELERELAVVAPREAVLDAPAAPTPERLADEVLRGRGRLVEFVEGSEQLAAYVVTPDGIRWQPLGDRAEIEALVAAFLAGLHDRERLATVAEIAARGRELHDRLLRPVLDDDGGPRAEDGPLVLVPCPTLAGLPFEALVVETASPEPRRFDELTFVLERHLVTYGPSSSVLALLARTPPRGRDGTTLVLADPTYGDESTPPAGARRQRSTVDLGALPRLLGTRTEAAAIARDLGADTLLEQAERSGSFRRGALDLRLGAEARPDALRGDLGGHRILHVAAHALLDPTDARGSGLALSPGAEDDGFVPLAEILELSLDADLTVLSACETARGELQRAEGVQSLARAFLHAGSRSVVASLWRVDDLATAQLMAAFYDGLLQQGLSPVEALRRARLSLLRGAEDLPVGDDRGGGVGDRRRASDGSSGRSTAHPYAWAAFVHDGLPR